MYRHVLICGEVGVGKSTLINKLLAGTKKPVYGYCTKSLNKRDDGYHEIYMYPPSDPEKKVYLADCDTKHRHINTDVFETYGVELLNNVGNDGIILMDEIGFMENNAEKFKARVLEVLDGDVPVLGAVKSSHPESEFLNAVRNHPKVKLYSITKDNRDELYDIIKKDGII